MSHALYVSPKTHLRHCHVISLQPSSTPSFLIAVLTGEVGGDHEICPPETSHPLPPPRPLDLSCHEMQTQRERESTRGDVSHTLRDFFCKQNDLPAGGEAEHLTCIFFFLHSCCYLWRAERASKRLSADEGERAGVKPCPAWHSALPLCYGDDAAVVVTDRATGLLNGLAVSLCVGVYVCSPAANDWCLCVCHQHRTRISRFITLFLYFCAANFPWTCCMLAAGWGGVL